MNYYNEIKNELMTYYEVGKLLIEAQGGEERAKYGDRLIKEYSKRLTLELGKEYTFSALTRMRKFFLISKKVATLSQLSWSHYIELLKLYNIDKNIKDITHDKTIGIIIVRKDNKFIMEYCSDSRIFHTTYMLVSN